VTSHSTGHPTSHSTPGHPTGRGDDGARDTIAVPLSLLLWGLVLIALAYGVISTLDKVTALFS
jgi:hypothetical protein